MHAYLITGGTFEERKHEIEKRVTAIPVSQWDSVTIGGSGIDAVREFQKELFIRPRSGSHKAGIIEHAHQLTTEAQNALLKLLEEPPVGVTIFSETDSPEALLPTILSRVSVIRLATKRTGDTEIEALLQQILASSAGQKLLLLTPFVASHDEAVKFIDRAIPAARDMILKTYDAHLAKLIKNMLTARAQLSVNVNQKLVLDNIFL